MMAVVLNVGDGDGIIIRFPRKQGEDVCCAVVDCYKGQKAFDALKAIGAKKFVSFVPRHSDHTMGMGKLIKLCLEHVIRIEQFWDSGFHHVSKIHYDLITVLREHPEINVIFPTSGYETIINKERIQVLSPSIQLKNRYNTIGTNINNASIVLKLEYPPKDIAPYYQKSDPFFEAALEQDKRLKQHVVILGGDAQFDAWPGLPKNFLNYKKQGTGGR